MTIKQLLNGELDRRFSWSFLGVVLALFFGVFTLYDKFIADKTPQLSFDIIASSSVLDIKENLPKLSISFDGTDIRKQNLSLRIISIKIVNDSSIDILKIHYDADDPIGLRLTSGKIIKTELTGTSNEYMRRNLSFVSPEDNIVYFKNIIFEGHQYFILKLLVLHPASDVPLIKAVGHVAGVKNIIVRDSLEEQSKIAFLSRIYGGTLTTQLFRIFSYPLIAILLLFAIAIPIMLVIGKVDDNQAAKHVNNFRAATSLSLNVNDEYIFSKYIENHYGYILKMKKLVENESMLKQYYDKYLVEKTPGHRIRYSQRTFFASDILPELIDSKFITVTEGIPTIDPHMKETLDHFVRYLKNTGVKLMDDQWTIIM